MKSLNSLQRNLLRLIALVPIFIAHQRNFLLASQVCFPSIFPKIIGGTNGDTFITSVGIGSDSTIAFGGYSSDLELVGSSSSTALIGLLDSAGDQQWLGYLSASQVSALSYSSANGQLVAAMRGSPTIFIVLNTQGTLISQYQQEGKPLTVETINQSNLVIDSNNNFCFSLQNAYNHLEIGCQSVLTGVFSFFTSYQTDMAWGYANSMTLMPSEQAAFIGGLLKRASDSHTLLSLIQFHLPTGSFLQTYTYDLSLSTSYYQIKSLSYMETGTACLNVLSLCFEHSDSATTNPILIGQMIFGDETGCGVLNNMKLNTTFLLGGQVFNKPAFNQFAQCLEIQSTTSYYQSFVLFFVPINNQLSLCQCYSNFYSISILQYMFCKHITTVFDKTYSIFLGGTLLTSDDYLAFGGLRYLPGDTSSKTPASSVSSNYLGFMMSFLSNRNCMSYSIASSPGYSQAYQMYIVFSLSVIVPTTQSNVISNPSLVLTSTINVVSNSLCNQRPLYTTKDISSVGMADETYIIGSTAQIVNLAPFTLNQNSITCIDSQILTVTVYLITSPTPLPSYIAFNEASLTLTVETSDELNIGTYPVLVQAESINGQQNSYTFNLFITVSCTDATLSCASGPPCPLLQQTYIVNFPANAINLPLISVNGVNCDVQLSLLTSFSSYSISSSFSTTTSNSMQEYNAIWGFSSSDNGLCQGQKFYAYDIQIQAAIVVSGISYSTVIVDFTLLIQHECAGSVLTPATPVQNPVFYDISIGSAIQIVSSWAQSVLNCPSILYSLSPSLSIVYLNGVNVEVSSTSLSDVGSYLFTETGVIDTYPSSSLTQSITVQITNNCGTSPITTHTVPLTTMVTTVNQPALVFSFSEWVNSYSQSCGPFSYSATQNSSTLLSTVTSPIAFDSSTRTFSVYSNDNSQAGNYSVVVTGVNNQYGESASITFLVRLATDCFTVEIVAYPLPSYTYNLRDPVLSISVPPFYTAPECCPFTYSFAQFDSNSIASSNPAISFNASAMTISVQSSDLLDSGSFTLTIVGTLSNFASNSQSMSFFITIIDLCRRTPIQTPVSGNDYYYLQYSGNQNYTFPLFIESLGYCGLFTYTANQFVSGHQIDLSSLFTFTSDTNGLTISYSCSTNFCQGTYYIQITGSLPNSYPSASFNIILHSVCRVLILNQKQGVIPNITQIFVEATRKQFTFPEYTQSPNCGTQIQYQAYLVNGSVLPQFISFNSDKRQFTIYSQTLNDTGFYQVKVIASLQNLNVPGTEVIENSNLRFNVSVLPPMNNLNLPIIRSLPFFDSPPANQYLVAGGSLQTFQLPKIINVGNSSVYQYVNLGSAIIFMSFQDGTFSSQPSELQIGSYKIIIQLSSDPLNPQSNIYEITVQVISEAQAFLLNISLPHLNKTDIHLENKIYPVFTEFTKFGKATISFNQNVKFNLSSMNLSLSLGNNNKTNQIREWSRLQLNEGILTLQVLFRDPDSIGQDEIDLIVVMFNDTNEYSEEGILYYIPNKTVISYEIPPQITLISSFCNLFTLNLQLYSMEDRCKIPLPLQQ